MAPVMGYWDIRGLAEPIRYLLSYKNVDFEDKRYEFNTGAWSGERCNLGLDFPNLPYLIDGDVRLSQSIAIMRYLAKKYSLDGNTDQETHRIFVAEEQLVDMRTIMIDISYSPNYKRLKPDFLMQIPDQMKLWSAFLGNMKFLASENITYVDFIAYDIFDYYQMFSPSSFKDLPNLKNYIKRMEKLPELQTHFKSPRYKRWPIFSPKAKFGGVGDEPKKE